MQLFEHYPFVNIKLASQEVQLSIALHSRQLVGHKVHTFYSLPYYPN